MNCPQCDRQNPADAKFCIYCAAMLQQAPAAPTVESTPAIGQTMRLPQPPTYSMPQAVQPVPAPVGPAMGKRHRGRSFNTDAIKAAWLIGLGVLLLTGDFFPGILVLIGITSFMSDSQQGQHDKALRNLAFFVGLAVLFWTSFFWPGILFLIGGMFLLNKLR